LAVSSTDGLEAVVARYDNGAVRFQGSNLDGEMHGEWSFFRRDGSVMRNGRFEHGKQVGIWRTYDRAGRIVKETDFATSDPG
jgi:antitoxin component YwqK of YwqJK toxin-antitoxin module